GRVVPPEGARSVAARPPAAHSRPDCGEEEVGMFASLRRYRLTEGSMDGLCRRGDEDFADRISRQPGFVSEFMDCGDGEIMTIRLFRDQGVAESSDERALEFVRDRLGAFDIERTEVIGGGIAVRRAMAELLEPAHA